MIKKPNKIPGDKIFDNRGSLSFVNSFGFNGVKRFYLIQNHQRNFITKIVKYDKICSIPNSMSVLPTLYPIIYDMMLNKTTGTFNLTNPNYITHNEILEMYKEIIDPSLEWSNFTIEEQNKILKSKRSNNNLNTNKLQSLYPSILPIKESVRNCLLNMKHKRE